MTFLLVWQVVGLSPLARGTLSYVRLFERRRRFIPAGAGNTLPEPSTLLPVPVYPRWRGEHKNVSTDINNHFGLSPLARGTQRQGTG